LKWTAAGRSLSRIPLIYIGLFTLIEWAAATKLIAEQLFYEAFLTNPWIPGPLWHLVKPFFDALSMASILCLPNLSWLLYASRNIWRKGFRTALESLRSVPLEETVLFTIGEWAALTIVFSTYFSAVGSSPSPLANLWAQLLIVLILPDALILPNVLWLTLSWRRLLRASPPSELQELK